MPRLPRPAIPLEVRCRVALRQLGEMWPDAVLAAHARAHGRLLAALLARLAELLACAPAALRLDHDPALGLREKIIRGGEHVGYAPAANDPEHLVYREAHAHHIKTNVRGDGAQFSDTALMKRERRRQKKRMAAVRSARKHRKSKWPKGRRLRGRGFERRKPCPPSR